MPWNLILPLLSTIIQAIANWHSSNPPAATATAEEIESHEAAGKALVALEAAHGHLQNVKI